MKKNHVAFCLPSRSGIGWELHQSLINSLPEGFTHEFIMVEGIADLVLTRNVTINRALDTSAELHVWADDDMVFDCDMLREMIAVAQSRKVAVAANYIDATGTPTNTRIKGLTVAGMGLMVVPVVLLGSLSNHLWSTHHSHQPFIHNDEECMQYFYSGPMSDGDFSRWIGEDYFFCLSIGGVELFGRAGHKKEVVLWPKPRLCMICGEVINHADEHEGRH